MIDRLIDFAGPFVRMIFRCSWVSDFGLAVVCLLPGFDRNDSNRE